MPLELHALIKSENEDTDLDRQEQEAYYVVEQVKHILDNKLVYDAKNNAYRKATYKDIVILERGMSNARRLQKYLKIIIFRSMLIVRKVILNKRKYD